MKSKIIVLISIMSVLVSCSDTGAVRDVQGAYRYKTTGKVVLEENYPGATKGDTLVANLDNESGTLDVVSLHDGDALLLTFDQLNGDVMATQGTTDGSRLQFTPYTRTLEVPTTVKYFDTLHIGLGLLIQDSVIVRERNEYETYDITVNGYADVYDNTLIFKLNYSGRSQTTERTLRGAGITSLAKRN